MKKVILDNLDKSIKRNWEYPELCVGSIPGFPFTQKVKPHQKRETLSKFLHKHHYQLNLILFSFLTAWLVFWFDKHLELYLTQGFFVGGSLCAWGIVRLVSSFLFKDDVQSTARQLLGQRRATEFMVVGFFVLGVLWFTTSSIYIIYEGAASASGENQFEVEILSQHADKSQKADKSPSTRKVVVQPYERIFGIPRFLQFKSTELQFRITNLRNRKTVCKTLGRGNTLRLRVPTEFEEKQFYVVRLIPGRKLITNLPPAHSAAMQSYYLQITVDGRTHRLENFSQESVYAGASREDLEWLITHEDGATQLAKLRKYLFQLGVSNQQGQPFLDAWELNKRPLPTMEFNANQQMQIEVGRTGSIQPDDNIVPDKPIVLKVDKLSITEEGITVFPLEGE